MIKLYKASNPNELTPKELSDLEKELKHPNTNDTSSDQLIDFLLWSRGLPSRQKSFAQFVSKKTCKIS